MAIIVAALIGSLAIPLYFLALMADGRRLHEKLRERQASRAPRAPEEESPLITSEHATWLTPPYRMREDTPASWPPL